MFGLSAGEFVILLVVGIVVLGPQKLPGMMRTAGRWVRKLRRMSTDLRAQSGIDRILREEGLDRELRELRELKSSLSRQAMLDSLVDATNRPIPDRSPTKSTTTASSTALTSAASTSAAAVAVDLTKPRSENAAIESAGSPEPDAHLEPPASAPQPNSVAARIRPAPGAVPRGAGPAKEPSPSFREREYPLWGPDHYEALPDDLDPEEEALSASQAQGHGLPEWKPEEPLHAAPIDPNVLEEALA